MRELLVFELELNIIDRIMKMHNSTEANDSKEKRFLIQYQQNSFTVLRKGKGRYSQTTETSAIRNYLASEADVQARDRFNVSQDELLLKQSRTERPHKKQALKLPLKMVGSLADVIAEVNPGGSEAKDEKDFPKIPIEYNDERANGSLADFLRLRVIYRGYAPKNTYYFLKSLSMNQIEEKPQKQRGEFELQFNSRFESGNLAAAARKSQREFWLFMREDTNTFGLRQWFYFSVYNKKAGKYKFRIYKYSKYYSLYKEGMKPFVRDNLDTQWRQAGQNIKYEQEAEIKSNFLEFEYQFQRPGMQTQFATQPPYTYTMLKNYLKTLADSPSKLKIRKAGESLAGLDIPLIKISQPHRAAQKSAIIIIARTHPSEVASNYALEGFIDKLNELPELTSYFDFFIVPMVNPDGVFFGNHRTGVMGQDLNRNFHSTEEEVFPQIRIIQKLIENVKSSQRIEYLLDLHGHSAKRNIFAYGDQQKIGSSGFAFTHIIPKLLSEQISTFKYPFCVFRQAKEKKNTARVYLSRRYRINALTFEESYGLIDQGHITIRHWKNFGIALADSLVEYKKIFSQGKEEALLNYLSEEMKYHQELNERRMKKKLKKMDTERSSVMERVRTKSEYTEGEMNINRKSSKLQLKEEKNEQEPKRQFSQISEEDTINQEELSSGDQSLENNDDGMEYLKREILKIGCLKDGVKREAFNIPEKKLQIRNSVQPIIHEQRASMAPRILKFQMKKKEEIPYINFNRIHQQQETRSLKKPLNITDRSERESIELPYLRR